MWEIFMPHPVLWYTAGPKTHLA